MTLSQNIFYNISYIIITLILNAVAAIFNITFPLITIWDICIFIFFVGYFNLIFLWPSGPNLCYGVCDDMAHVS